VFLLICTTAAGVHILFIAVVATMFGWSATNECKVCPKEALRWESFGSKNLCAMHSERTRADRATTRPPHTGFSCTALLTASITAFAMGEIASEPSTINKSLQTWPPLCFMLFELL